MRTSTTILPVLAAVLTASAAFAQDKPAPAPTPAAPADSATPAAPAAPATTEVYDPKALEPLKAKKGQKITVEGTIVGSGEGKGAVRRYLNFTKNFRESVSLVFLVSKNPTEFTKEKLNEWMNKKVRATGTLSEYNGSLQIEIEKPDQLVEVK